MLSQVVEPLAGPFIYQIIFIDLQHLNNIPFNLISGHNITILWHSELSSLWWNDSTGDLCKLQERSTENMCSFGSKYAEVWKDTPSVFSSLLQLHGKTRQGLALSITRLSHTIQIDSSVKGAGRESTYESYSSQNYELLRRNPEWWFFFLQSYVYYVTPVCWLIEYPSLV